MGFKEETRHDGFQRDYLFNLYLLRCNVAFFFEMLAQPFKKSLPTVTHRDYSPRRSSKYNAVQSHCLAIGSLARKFHAQLNIYFVKTQGHLKITFFKGLNILALLGYKIIGKVSQDFFLIPMFSVYKNCPAFEVQYR